MHNEIDPNHVNHGLDIITTVSVILISLISGFISIAQRIARGVAISILWISSEFSAALLCGYLMFDAYPNVKDMLPQWCTLWVAVAITAHSGGRLLQILEALSLKRLYNVIKPEDKDNKPE